MPSWSECQVIERGEVVRGRVRFARDFVGFDGHFEGNPLLPGFMHVQAAIDLLQAAGVPGQFAGIESARFVRSILPEEWVDLLARQDPGGWEIELLVDGQRASAFLLRWLTPPA